MLLNYIQIIKNIKIKYVEIGFWSPVKNLDYGEYANISNNLLKDKIFDKSIFYGVMINYSDIKKFSVSEIVNKIKKINNLNFIRIACHKNEYQDALSFVNPLKKIGFSVMINLMQITDYSLSEIKKAVNQINKVKVDVLYIADSFGSLNIKEIKKIKKELNKFKGKTGIHAHDNLNNALKNTVFAINNGFDWFDSTMLGMGRGAGNTRTEEFIKIYNPSEKKIINKFINKFMLPMKKRYKWGSNKFYKFAAFNSIHPTYIQKMLSDKRFNKKIFSTILKDLSLNEAKKFDPFNINEIKILFNSKKYSNKGLPTNLKNKIFLICAPGVNLKKNKNKIINFIKKINNLIVINLNIHNNIPEKYINFYSSCHPLQLNISERITNKKIFLPYSMINNALKKKFIKNQIFDYGIKIGKNYNAKKKYVISNNYLAISYTLGICAALKASKIFVCGMDGDEKKKIQFGETQNTLSAFKKKYPRIKIIFLNKSKYKV